MALVVDPVSPWSAVLRVTVESLSVTSPKIPPPNFAVLRVTVELLSVTPSPSKIPPPISAELPVTVESLSVALAFGPWFGTQLLASTGPVGVWSVMFALGALAAVLMVFGAPHRRQLRVAVVAES